VRIAISVIKRIVLLYPVVACVLELPGIWTTNQLCTVKFATKITIYKSNTDRNPNPKFCRLFVRFLLSPSRLRPDDGKQA